MQTTPLCLAVTLFVSLPVFGAQLDVPANYSTIQQAINIATNGDTVFVAPGTYHESIDFLAKDIVVLSAGGPSVTIIDPLQTNRAVSISGAVGRTARLEGFTLTNGAGGLFIGGGAAATVTNNHIIANVGCSGAGVYIGGSSPLLVSNLIAGNFSNGCSGGGGGGIYIVGAAAAEIVGNIITNNFKGEVYLFSSGAPLLQGNIIGWNTNGNGISFVNHSDVLMVNNLVAGASGTGIAGTVPANSRGPYILNNTIVANRDTYSGIAINGFASAALIANNIVVAHSNYMAMHSGGFNNVPHQPMMRNNNFYSRGGLAYSGLGANPLGTHGNISVEPDFVAADKFNYRLRTDSLLINSGDNRWLPGTVTNDLANNPRIRGNTVDMGAYEFQTPTSDISYHWLQTYGLSRDGSADYTDLDGDQLNNWQEWRTDTVPTNALSALRLLTVNAETRGTSVTWIGGPNRSYTLERATNLVDGFSIIASNIAGATGTNWIADRFASGPGPFFYRISAP